MREKLAVDGIVSVKVVGFISKLNPLVKLNEVAPTSIFVELK